ncbi:hypothetical protein FNV43_RR01625 [Rhamnella rubrinervis]|uniref:Uncharacterized protein n=1 Tax=Rhamnella rubrinervis TaxID=2594499 RepID=A0A8K0HRA9_9ROSA|nr:hypothetical protein FNV43_RR01625 [Rhamnella rubrinervis]
MRPALIDRSCLRVYFEEIRVLKASLRLDTLAWDNIIGFRPILAGLRIGVMINGHGAFDFIVEDSRRPYEKSKSWVPGSMVARLKLKGIDGRAPLEWSPRLI